MSKWVLFMAVLGTLVAAGSAYAAGDAAAGKEVFRNARSVTRRKPARTRSAPAWRG